MTIKEAIKEAKERSDWSIVAYEPTSVTVEFMTVDKYRDETELDLYGDDPEQELKELWESLCEEFDSLPNLVLSVEAYGYIRE